MPWPKHIGQSVQENNPLVKINYLLPRVTKGFTNLFLLYLRLNLWRIHPKRFLTRLNSIPINHPIFLLGVQGGGLTLIARILRRNPRILSATGNASFWAGPDEMQNVMGDFLPPELTGLKHKIPDIEKYPERDWIYATDDLLPQYRQVAADATPEIAQHFQKAIRIFLAIYAKNPLEARFVDKSQSYTLRLSFISALLKQYEPYFVLVTRNPFAACYRAATKVKSIQSLPLSLENKLELATQHWANSFGCALDDQNETKRLLIIRFEDLLKDPQYWVEKICEFVQLDFQPSMLPSPNDRFPLGSTGSTSGDHKWYPLRPDVNKPYLDKLEPWMIDIIHHRTSELAEIWDYSPKGP